MKPVRVAVQAEDAITQAGLASYLGSWPELTVVDRDGPAEREVLVVQVDRIVPGVLAGLREQAADALVPKVLLTGEFRECDIMPAVESRVVAVLPRAQTSGERLAETVISVASGRAALPPDMLGHLLENVRKLQRDVLSPRGLGSAGLSAREVDVLRLMAEGRDTAQIADELCYSERTVKGVIYAMTNRLNLRNRPHAVAYAMRAGVI